MALSLPKVMTLLSSSTRKPISCFLHKLYLTDHTSTDLFARIAKPSSKDLTSPIFSPVKRAVQQLHPMSLLCNSFLTLSLISCDSLRMPDVAEQPPCQFSDCPRQKLISNVQAAITCGPLLISTLKRHESWFSCYPLRSSICHLWTTQGNETHLVSRHFDVSPRRNSRANWSCSRAVGLNQDRSQVERPRGNVEY